MNKVILIGNLSRDPETRTTQSGHSVTGFTVAVNRRKSKDGVRECDFISCTAWDKTGELIAKYLRKGSKCCVEGQLQTRSYDSQDGSKRFVTEVLVSEVEFLPSAQRAQEGAAQNAGAAVGLTQADEDDLPF